MTKYKYLFSLNALIYLSLPIFALFPEMTSYLFQVAPFEGSRLDSFQNLMFAVTPIGLMYVFALVRQEESFIDLSIFYRLLWVGPFLLFNWIGGYIDGSLAFAMITADVLIPILAIAFVDRNQIVRARQHIKNKIKFLSNKILFVESMIGFVVILVGSIVHITSGTHGYASSFIISIFAIYYFWIFWLSFTQTRIESIIGLNFIRFIVLGIILFTSLSNIFTIKVFAAIWLFGTFMHNFTYLWEYARKKISIKKWLIYFGIILSFTSSVWYFLFYLFTSGNPPALSWNVYRQDLMISAFVLLLGILVESMTKKSSKHVAIISWLLPFSSIWFTTSTKLLVHLGVGTPFHPSWPARGLAPVWGNSVITDINFSLATTFMTAISTTYVAFVVLRYLKKEGWLSFSWHGIAVILVSSLWMIVSSSGLPAPTESLNVATIPPFFPVNPITAVSIHVLDILFGMLLIMLGIIFNNRLRLNKAAIYIVPVLLWSVSIYPKIIAHISF